MHKRKGTHGDRYTKELKHDWARSQRGEVKCYVQECKCIREPGMCGAGQLHNGPDTNKGTGILEDTGRWKKKAGQVLVKKNVITTRTS